MAAVDDLADLIAHTLTQEQEDAINNLSAADVTALLNLASTLESNRVTESADKVDCEGEEGVMFIC